MDEFKRAQQRYKKVRERAERAGRYWYRGFYEEWDGVTYKTLNPVEIAKQTEVIKSEPVAERKPPLEKEGTLEIAVVVDGKKRIFRFEVLTSNYTGQKTDAGLRDTFRAALKGIFGARIHDVT